MQVKRLFIIIIILFSFLLPSLSQAQQKQPKVVSIPDKNLAAAVRQEIGNSITTRTLMNLTSLIVFNSRITDLTGLEHAQNLRFLGLGGDYISGKGVVNSNVVSDYTPLLGLTQLTWLELGNGGISDISMLSNLTQLRKLHLYGNNISDISPLKNLTQLRLLDLNGSSISEWQLNLRYICVVKSYRLDLFEA